MADKLGKQLAHRDRLDAQGYAGDDGVEGFVQAGEDVGDEFFIIQLLALRLQFFSKALHLAEVLK
jgi:hypothetical protein